MSKLTKILTAGYDNTGPGVVLRQTRWPHRLLQSTVPGYNVVKHKDLTFHLLMNGLLSKALSETPNVLISSWQTSCLSSSSS